MTSCLVRVKVATQLGKMTIFTESGVGSRRGWERSGREGTAVRAASQDAVGRDSLGKPSRLAKLMSGRGRLARGQ